MSITQADFDQFQSIVKHRSNKDCPIPDDYRQRAEHCKAVLLGPLTELARKNGYHLVFHGTGIRDIDLIAIPWERICAHPACLAEDIQRKCEELVGHAIAHPHERDYYNICGSPGRKPHGRLGWTFHLGGGPYIDLSVIPPKYEAWNPDHQ